MQYDWNGEQRISARKVRLQGMVAYEEQVATKGYAILCQSSDDGHNWQTIGEWKGDNLPGTLLHYKLHSDPNKQEAQDYLPARVLNEVIRFNLPIKTQHFRLLLQMEGAAHWDIRQLQFMDENDNEVDVLPSRQFTSLWMSDGGGEQWIYTDLGQRQRIEQLHIDWFLSPKKGCVQVSDDAKTLRATLLCLLA